MDDFAFVVQRLMSSSFISISISVVRPLEIVAAIADAKGMLSTDLQRSQRCAVDPTGNRYLID